MKNPTLGSVQIPNDLCGRRLSISPIRFEEAGQRFHLVGPGKIVISLICVVWGTTSWRVGQVTFASVPLRRGDASLGTARGLGRLTLGPRG